MMVGMSAAGVFGNPFFSFSARLLHPVPVTQSPQHLILDEGGGANFDVRALAGGKVRYRWNKDGAPLKNDGRISGADTRTFVVDPAALSDAGDHHVEVFNRPGAATSGVAVLTVRNPPQCSDVEKLQARSREHTLKANVEFIDASHDGLPVTLDINALGRLQLLIRGAQSERRFRNRFSEQGVTPSDARDRGLRKRASRGP